LKKSEYFSVSLISATTTTTTTTTTQPPPTTLSPPDNEKAIVDLNNLLQAANALLSEIQAYTGPTEMVSGYLTRDNDLITKIKQLQQNLPYTTQVAIDTAISDFIALREEYDRFLLSKCLRGFGYLRSESISFHLLFQQIQRHLQQLQRLSNQF
jgi:hypothetical protein